VADADVEADDEAAEIGAEFDELEEVAG